MKRRLIPLAVVLASAIVTVSIIAAELAVLQKIDTQIATSGLPTLGSATMMDGSTLKVHAVSVGRNHQLNAPVLEPGNRFGIQPVSNRIINHPTGEDRLVVFVSRHDSDTNEFLGFDWWSHCSVTDSHGDEVFDQRAQINVFSMSSSSSAWSTQRPRFQKNSHRSLKGEDNRIIVSTEFPMFRSPQTADLKFFNAAGELVATIPFTSPLVAPAMEWTPKELPVTVDNGPVSVTLRDVKLTAHERGQHDDQPGPRQRLSATAELKENGQAVSYWSFGLADVADVLGNEANPYNVDLSAKEPAWRVTYRATRTVDAPFQDDERIVLSGIQLPAENSFDTSLTSISATSQTLVPVALAGTGNQGFHVAGFANYNRGYSSGGSVPIATQQIKNARYHLNWRDVGGMQGQHLQLRTDAPCLILRNVDLPQKTQVLVRTKDADGRDVRSHIRPFYDFAYLIFFDAKPDVGELTCELLLQTPLEFEFFIKPPELETEDR